VNAVPPIREPVGRVFNTIGAAAGLAGRARRLSQWAYGAGSRGIRNAKPLTPAQQDELMQAVRNLGLDPSDFLITRTPSVYSDQFDVVLLGPNAFPAAEGATARSVFGRLTPRAVIAHEAGHMITTRAGTAFPGGTVLDEVQASIVGRTLPGLSSMERFQLLRDAVERAKAAGESPRSLLERLNQTRAR
jgi:hypothetical protein